MWTKLSVELCLFNLILILYLFNENCRQPMAMGGFHQCLIVVGFFSILSRSFLTNPIFFVIVVTL
jgi:hypothetical protein